MTQAMAISVLLIIVFLNPSEEAHADPTGKTQSATLRG
jgi:hypothetical protein